MTWGKNRDKRILIFFFLNTISSFNLQVNLSFINLINFINDNFFFLCNFFLTMKELMMRWFYYFLLSIRDNRWIICWWCIIYFYSYSFCFLFYFEVGHCSSLIFFRWNSSLVIGHAMYDTLHLHDDNIQTIMSRALNALRIYEIFIITCYAIE